VSDLLVVAPATLAVAVVAMAVTAVVARRVGRVSVVDVTWGLGLTAIAVLCALLGSGWVPWLLAALVAAWGGRLSWHIFRRSRGHGEDPRYTALLGGRTAADGSAWFAAAVRKVFVVQAAALWFVSWPLQAAAVGSDPWPLLVAAGAGVWLVGFVFETVGDAQLAAYKRDPDRGPVMDRGLWAWTRHPNYFGDACVWWGVWLAGAAATGWLPALVTLPAPVTMTWFLAYATGARPLERTMMQRPGYPEYAARTSMFFPLPPRPRGRRRRR
jgi:steroid 5-alpha reductase family enzyme